jgi:kynureninase
MSRSRLVPGIALRAEEARRCDSSRTEASIGDRLESVQFRRKGMRFNGSNSPLDEPSRTGYDVSNGNHIAIRKRFGLMSAPILSLDYARSLDASDPLRGFRSKFGIPRDRTGVPLVYFAGHSLGLMPLAAREEMNLELDDWEHLGVLAHESARRPWIPYHEALRPELAQFLGCRDDEVVLMNSLTVNLHLMLASFYRPESRRRSIVIEAGAFPSDRYAVATHLEWHGLDPRKHLIEIAPAPGEDLIDEQLVETQLVQRGEEIALVLWPGVQYLTGQVFDLARIAKAARGVGAIIGFDLAHSVGNVPLTLSGLDADFAAWCSYKYMNAGPGAIAGCYVHSRHFGQPGRHRLGGWWGHEMATRFDMLHDFKAAHGASGFHISNQSIFATTPLIASLAILRDAHMERLREKSIALTGFLERLLLERTRGLTVITPRALEARGAQLSLRVRGGAERGRGVFKWLMAHGVICDWREPDIIRVAPVPAYNSFEDAYRFVECLEQGLRGTD